MNKDQFWIFKVKLKAMKYPISYARKMNSRLSVLQYFDYLKDALFRRWSMETSNSPVTKMPGLSTTICHIWREDGKSTLYRIHYVTNCWSVSNSCNQGKCIFNKTVGFTKYLEMFCIHISLLRITQVDI